MKKFLLKICYFVLPLWFIIIALSVYYNLFYLPDINGDLGRIGKIRMAPYISGGLSTILYDNVLYEKELRDTTIDFLTIGDSFSQQREKGYQNYMANKGYSILNYTNNVDNKFQLLYDLMRFGYVDSSNVKTIIVECVERNINYLNSINSKSDSIKHIVPKQINEEPRWSLTEIRNFIVLKLGFNKPVCHAKLDRKFFSGEKGNDLYFYYKDLEDTSISLKPLRSMKSNIDLLTETAQSLGIHLIFLICPDKYDLYQDYIIDNPFPRKRVCEDLNTILSNNRNVIIAKDILSKYIVKGDLDIYHFNDTHWSYKSAEIIAEELEDRIQVNSN